VVGVAAKGLSSVTTNAMPAVANMTADEFLALERAEGDERWYELVEGELVVNERELLHNETQQRVLVALHSWAHAEPGRGTVWLPIDTVLDTGNVYSPDIVWFAQDRGPSVHDRRLRTHRTARVVAGRHPGPRAVRVPPWRAGLREL
jgi:Uma2 family endonuclease